MELTFGKMGRGYKAKIISTIVDDSSKMYALFGL